MELNIPVILDRIPYIDTVWLLISKDVHFDDKDKTELEQFCRSANLTTVGRRRRWIMGDKWGQRLQIQLPTMDALLWLHNRFDVYGQNLILMTRVDFSLDLITHCLRHARQLQAFFNCHLVQRWHGAGIVEFINGTMYFRCRKSRNNIAVYSGKLSKITKTDCCHIDWRICKADTLRRAGFNSIEDLINWNPYEFWKKRLVLMEMDYYKLGKILKNMGRRKIPFIKKYGPFSYDVFRRAGGLIKRCTQLDDESYSSVQKIIDFFRICDKQRKRAVRGCLIKLSNDEFLPKQTV